ncbi:MAG: outer membrane beta-barrel protein [Cyclobacteriaceae bacterium]
MKKILMILTMVAISGLATAQHSAGDMNLNLGIGLGNNLVVGDQALPPIGVSFEYGIKDEISVGGYLGYTSSDFASGFGDWTYSYTIIGARGSYHHDLLGNKKIDTYGGLMLGYYIVSVDFGNTGITTGGETNSFAYAAYIGGRYAFTDNLGAFAELGYGIALLQIGANLKF